MRSAQINIEQRGLAYSYGRHEFIGCVLHFSGIKIKIHRSRELPYCTGNIIWSHNWCHSNMGGGSSKFKVKGLVEFKVIRLLPRPFLIKIIKTKLTRRNCILYSYTFVHKKDLRESNSP